MQIWSVKQVDIHLLSKVCIQPCIQCGMNICVSLYEMKRRRERKPWDWTQGLWFELSVQRPYTELSPGITYCTGGAECFSFSPAIATWSSTTAGYYQTQCVHLQLKYDLLHNRGVIATGLSVTYTHPKIFICKEGLLGTDPCIPLLSISHKHL